MKVWMKSSIPDFVVRYILADENNLLISSIFYDYISSFLVITFAKSLWYDDRRPMVLDILDYLNKWPTCSALLDDGCLNVLVSILICPPVFYVQLCVL